MTPPFLDRRSFLAAAAGSLAASAAPRSASGSSAQSTGRIRLGGPVFVQSDDPEELARAHKSKGYRAAYCPKIPLDARERIRDTERAFQKADVAIAEVGRWVNLLDADPEKRRQNLATVTDGLALADAIGARCCVDIAGSFNTTSWFGPHPENLSPRFFDAVVENARKIIDAVKPTRTVFTYEMMAWSLPDSPDACLKMIAAVDARPSPSTSTPAISSTRRSATTARARSSASATGSSGPGSRASTPRTSPGRWSTPSTCARSASVSAASTTACSWPSIRGTRRMCP